MRTVLASFFVVSQLWAQALTERNAHSRLQLDPAVVVRLNRAGDKLVAVENPQRISIFSTASGERESRYTVHQLDQPILDFDLDASGSLYLLTQDRELLKWTPQSPGFVFRTLVLDSATAVTVDAAGQRIFVAGRNAVWMLDATGAVSTRAANSLRDIERLRLDETSGILYAQGPDFIASLSPSLQDVTLHSAKGALPGASSTSVAAAYPTGFTFEPLSQTVYPGGTARFAIRTLPRDGSAGSLNLTVEAPLPYELGRSALSYNDAVQLVIPIPVNQAPGVHRVVARLNGGASGIANAVFIVPFDGQTNIPLSGTAVLPAPVSLPDPYYRLVSSPDPQCAVATVVDPASSPLGGPFWDYAPYQLNFWISGRSDAMTGCLPGLYRYRYDFDLRQFNPAKANIAVAAWADNAVTLEINGVPIASEPQEVAEAEAFRIPRVYGIPRDALRQGNNSLDFIVRNDAFGSAVRNPTGLRVQMLNATAVPVQNPEPPPVGDFWLSLSPPFKFVNGTTAYYTVNIHRTGGFVGTPTLVMNLLPPHGYSYSFSGNVLQVTRDPNAIIAPMNWRFAVLGIFNQTTRSVDGAFFQNAYVPVDLPVFSTGVLQPGVPATDNSVDTHYTLTTSADPNYPGPNALVADASLSPFGPWVLNDLNSKWISPRRDPNGLNAPGVYVYRTTFDLGLGDPQSSAIALRWAADNDTKIFLNGYEVGALFNIENFRLLNETLITEGFRQGINVLEFAVNNANLGGPSQTGLRVEINGAQSARNPSRIVQVLRNRTATGPVLLAAGGFTYTAPTGVTVTSNATNLLISASDAAPLGVFPVNVTYNVGGGVASMLVVVGAREAVSYIAHSTGQADEGSVDPNYRLFQSVDLQFQTQNAIVILSNLSPISLGFWTPNTINSRWIAPRADTLRNNAPGDYRYRTTFDLTGRNLSDAMLALEWACDNRGRIELNGQVVDRADTGQDFRAMRPVSITTGFRDGVNTLDFVVTNDGAPYLISPTGLHVNILGAFAVSRGTAPGPDYTVTPDPSVRQIVAGQPATFDVRVTPNFTFVDPVNFSVVNPPSGFTFTFNPPSTKTSTILTVTSTPQTAAGTYQITIRGRYGDIVRDVQVRLDVAPGAPSLRVASTGGASVGSADPNYTLVDGLGLPLTAYVTDISEAPPNWSNGTWISPSRTIERSAAGTYRYRTSFDLTGFNPSTAVLRGFWDADDTAIAVLNGVVVATLNKVSLFDTADLLINSGFRAGMNTLEFVVTNTTPSSTGLMVTFTSVTAQLQP